MSDEVLQTVAAMATDYQPRPVAPGVLLLETLGLHVRVEAAPNTPPGLFIGLFTASEAPAGRGIGVTCVGLPPDGAKDAAANWALGVLPVLARWKEGHSCFVGTRPLSVNNRTFEVLLGPVVARGECEGGTEPRTDGYLELLDDALAGAKLRSQPHWIECFAIRMSDGSADATCRLDNRDWRPGHRLLLEDAGRWTGSTPLFYSRRQFLLLVPTGAPEPEKRSFWSRLFGRG